MDKRRGKRFEGWSIVGWVSLGLAAISATILLVGGTDEAGLRWLTRTTAQTSFMLFTSAFAASSLCALWPRPWSRWLLRNRRYLGVSFAVSHFIHLGAIIALARTELDAPTLIGGGGAYLFIAAMAATSFDRTAAWLGPRAWRRLHTIGAYWIWTIFFVSYAPRAAIESVLYTPLVLVLLATLGLRLYVRQRGRRTAGAVSASARGVGLQ